MKGDAYIGGYYDFHYDVGAAVKCSFNSIVDLPRHNGEGGLLYVGKTYSRDYFLVKYLNIFGFS